MPINTEMRLVLYLRAENHAFQVFDNYWTSQARMPVLRRHQSETRTQSGDGGGPPNPDDDGYGDGGYYGGKGRRDRD
eukprot:2393080-Amphidinium_carterae.1